MPIHISSIEIALFIIVCLLGLYYWLLHKKGILKPLHTSRPLTETLSANNDIIPLKLMEDNRTEKMTMPAAIASPILPEPEPEDETGLEILDDEDTTLLKEAERLVDRIQDTINHIASDPPNPEEVTSKIKSIVQPYQLLKETEYYDSINTYIALSVERDCGITISPADLQALWN